MKRRPTRESRKRIDYSSVTALSGRRKIYLDANAFVSLVLSGIETYRKESYGLLIGEKGPRGTYVRAALPYQTARRTRTSVAVLESRRSLMGGVLETISEPKLGEFHSHVDGASEQVSECLSPEDMIGVRDRDIQVLVALRKSRARRGWRHNNDGSISGSAGKFFVKLRAFENLGLQGGAAVPRVARLRCRYAVTTANRGPFGE